MAEILDLRQQVAMLSGFGPGTSGDGENGPYISSYDVVSKEPSMNARPAPFVGHRIKHQRINPSLIIKEQDIVIEKIVGKYLVCDNPYTYTRCLITISRIL